MCSVKMLERSSLTLDFHQIQIKVNKQLFFIKKEDFAITISFATIFKKQKQ
jgi:hypothetical protein